MYGVVALHLFGLLNKTPGFFAINLP